MLLDKARDIMYHDQEEDDQEQVRKTLTEANKHSNISKRQHNSSVVAEIYCYERR
jgi:hypothetical protein